jgi:hypothetical protein
LPEPLSEHTESEYKMSDLKRASMIFTTLNKIRAHVPCHDRWVKLLRHLGKTQADDEPLALGTILYSNGLQDALWCLRAVDGHQREIRLYAVWCARQAQYFMDDPRSLVALDVAERHANGQATDDELRAAWDAAWDAASDAAWDAASDAAKAAAKAAWAEAWDAASDAAWDAAKAAAKAAAWDAAKAVASDAAWDAAKAAASDAAWAEAWDAAWAEAWAEAWDAAWAEAWDAAWAAAKAEFRRVFCGGEKE